MNIIELTHEQANVVMKSAQLEIIWLMFSCCPIPHHCDCDDMFSHAISTFIQAVLNGAMAKPPDGHQQKLTLAMRDIQHHFKAHCMHSVQFVYGLRLEDTGDGQVDPEQEDKHCAHKVKELFFGFEFLQDNSSCLFFSSSYFKHFILDTLAQPPYKFASYLEAREMDNFFALGGMAILAALDDYTEGYFVTHDLQNDLWQRHFVSIFGLIKEMQEDEPLRDWLHMYQCNLLDRGRASLHHHTHPTGVVAHM